MARKDMRNESSYPFQNETKASRYKEDEVINATSKANNEKTQVTNIL